MIDYLGYLSDLSILAACIMAILKWRRLPGVARLIGIQVFLGAAAELTGWYLSRNHQPNAWVYNCYLLPETVLLTFAGGLLTKSRVLQKAIFFLLGLYAIVWARSIYLDRSSGLASTPFLFECIMLTAVYLQLCIQWYLKESDAFLKSPVIILCLSTIIYYGCNIPLFGTLNYMNAHYPETAEKLYTINFVLNMIRYLLVAYAFCIFPHADPANPKIRIG